MINKETVKTAVEEWLSQNEYFLVDVEMMPEGRIVIEIDHADGVWIEDCAELSRGTAVSQPCGQGCRGDDFGRQEASGCAESCQRRRAVIRRDR